MRRANLSEEYCSIARAGGEIVDTWSFLILRELFLANRTFEGLRRQTGMAPGSLHARLDLLIQAGILERRAPEGRPRKGQYFLTEKGLDLWPVLIAIKQWGDKWFGPWEGDLPPVSLVHRGSDQSLVLQQSCANTGAAVTARDARVVISPRFAENRSKRDALARATRRQEVSK